MLMLTFCWSFSACSKGDNPSENENQVETPLPDEGGNNDGSEEIVEPEVFVPLTLSDMYSFAKTVNEGFFAGIDEGSTQESFDKYIYSMKELFLNASDMLQEVKTFENIPCETQIKGEVLTVEDENLPEQVNKFYMIYLPEDENTYSKLEIRILFSYKDLDVNYAYDYYNIVVETNQKENRFSYSCAIEKSVASGLNNSTAKYSVCNIESELENLTNIKTYKVYSLERNKKLTNYSESMINNTNILNFSKSEFDGVNKSYINTTEGELCLRNPNSAEHALIVGLVSDLGQDLNLLQLGLAIKRVTGLSDALISCIGV